MILRKYDGIRRWITCAIERTSSAVLRESRTTHNYVDCGTEGRTRTLVLSGYPPSAARSRHSRPAPEIGDSGSLGLTVNSDHAVAVGLHPRHLLIGEQSIGDVPILEEDGMVAHPQTLTESVNARRNP
jgi:hypothetical protein